MYRPTAKLLLAVAIICLGGVSLVFAQAYPWTMTLSASDGFNHSTVVIGAQAGATDGYDASVDNDAPPAPPPPSAQIYSSITSADPLHRRMSRDMRSSNQDSVVFNIYRDGEDDSLIISWTLPPGFAPRDMKYGIYFGSGNPASYTSMLEAPLSLALESGARLRIIYMKPAGVDTLPPSVGNIFPPDGNREAPCNTSISLDLTDASGVNTGTVVMTVAGSTIPITSLQFVSIAGGVAVTYDPSAADSFADGQTVVVCISANDRSPIPNEMTSPFCWEFTTNCGGIVDLIPPSVRSASPANGTENVPVSGNVSVVIEDNQTGVDLGSVVFTFDGVQVTPVFTPTPQGYQAVYTYGPLANLSTHTWCITGCDMAPVPNCMATTVCYSFTTVPPTGGCVSFSKTLRVLDQDPAGGTIAQNVLTFGTDMIGTDGYDETLDMAIPLILPGTFQAYFPQGSDTASSRYHLSTDIRYCRLPNHVWKIKGVNVGDHMAVRWSPVDFLDPDLPIGATFKIGVSDNEFTPPAEGALLNMQIASRIDVVSPTQVVWISYQAVSETTPPVVQNQVPAEGETGVCTTTPISFDIVDPESRVNQSSIHVWVADIDVTADLSITEISGGYGYHVVYVSDGLYPDATISVRVTASNLATPALDGDITYSFQTGADICAMNWSNVLTIRGVNLSDTATVLLNFGLNEAGTEGYDAGLDGPAPPAPPSGLDRVFSITASRPEFERLTTDIRNSSADSVLWKVIAGVPEDAFTPLWATWDPALLPSGGQLTIFQGFGSTVPTPNPGDLGNMQRTSSFTFDQDARVYILYRKMVVGRYSVTGRVTLEDHVDNTGIAMTISQVPGTLTYSTATSYDGNFAFPMVPSGTYRIVATRDSFVTLDTTITVSANVVLNTRLNWIRHAYCGTVTLNGAANNAGALVSVDGGTMTATTDAAGSYSIQVPFNGRDHFVTVSKPRYTTVLDTVVIPEGAPCDNNYTLDLTCFGFSGRITLSGETSHAGALIMVGGLTATSGADGSFALDSCLAAGNYTVNVSMECFDNASAEIVISTGAVTQDFTLTRTAVSLTGLITLAGASDFSGTTVTVGGSTYTTDVLGQFTIPGLTCGQRITLNATHSNYAGLDTTFTVVVGTTFSATLRACPNVTALNVTDSLERVVLSWGAVSGATEYVIYRNGTELATVTTGTTYTDATVVIGTSYTYNISVTYAACSSAQLPRDVNVTVRRTPPTERILVLDFDNGLANGGVGVSDQTVTWLRGLAGAGQVRVLAQNEDLTAYDQSWLNHFDLIVILTAINGASVDYFDAATAAKLVTFGGTAGKYLYWEGATAATDIITGGHAELQTLFNLFHVTRISAGAPAATGNAEYVRVQRTPWYQTATRFNYAYRTGLDNLMDYIGSSGTASVVSWSYTTSDTVSKGRVVKGDRTAFLSYYTAGITSPTPVHVNGRRLLDPYLCNWLHICTSVEMESRNAEVNAPTLYQNEPNPFGGMTTIRFAVPSDGPVNLEVYTVDGKLLETVVNDNLSAGSYSVQWFGNHLANGVYLYRLSTADGQSVKAMTLTH